MASQVTNYKCPACTGPLHFVGASGKLECDYCGSSYDVAEIEALYQKEEEQAQAAFAEGEDPSSSNGDWGEDGMKSYTCPSCGAELICTVTTAATACPYCGNPTIVPGQFGGTLKPDLVLPFKLDKEAATAALKAHYRGKLFLPRAFKSENQIEKLQGVYVPFWLFDAEAKADCRFDGMISHTTRQGDYRVTRTQHFAVHRAGTVRFEEIPTDASSKMPDGLMDALEPFPYGQLKPFSTAYLPGYLADKYDVSKEDCSVRVERRCKSSAESIMRDDVKGYQTVATLQSDVQVSPGKVRYALLPVWLLNTRWQDKGYLFAMNGQTGKLVGDLPVSKLRSWGFFGGLTVLLSALFYFLRFGHFLAKLFT